MRQISILLINFTIVITLTSKALGQQRALEGKFSIYTKHPDCEIVKTQAMFNSGHSFVLYSTCNGVDYKQFSSEKAEKGKWRFLNDSLVMVDFTKRRSMKFRILSDSLIELQNGSKFNRPQYKRE